MMKYKVGDVLSPNPSKTLLYHNYRFIIEKVDEIGGWYYYRCLEHGWTSVGSKEIVEHVWSLLDE